LDKAVFESYLKKFAAAKPWLLQLEKQNSKNVFSYPSRQHLFGRKKWM
jgi:hypothetical protein